MKQKQNLEIIFFVIIIVLIILGGWVYWSNQLSVSANGNSTNENFGSTTVESAKTADGIDFPVVVYSRSGLLNGTPEGIAERRNLEKKLINPYTDYQNENEINLVALYITVPQNIGEEYDVVGIFGSEKQYGTDEFSFGKREREYDYWRPECMGECVYSDAFKIKYPQIVK